MCNLKNQNFNDHFIIFTENFGPLNTDLFIGKAKK